MDTEEFISTLSKEGAKKTFPNPALISVGWFGAIAIYFAIVIAFSGLRSDIADKLLQPLFIAELSIILITAITAALAANWLALPDANQKSWMRLVPFTSLAALMGGLIYSISTSSNTTSVEHMAYGCAIHIITYSLLPGILVIYTIRKAAPVCCCWAGSMTGLSVGSFGYILLRLIENTDNHMHIFLWHFIPVILIMMVGMLIGKACFGRVWSN